MQNFKRYQKLQKALLAGECIIYSFEDEVIVFALAQKVKKEILQDMLESCGQLQCFTTDSFIKERGLKSNIINWDTRNLKKSLSQLLYDSKVIDDISSDKSVLCSFSAKKLLRINCWQARLLEFVADFDCLPLLVGGKVLLDPKEKYLQTSFEELLSLRTYNKKLLSKSGITKVSLLEGNFDLYSFYSQIDQHYHWAFVKNIDADTMPLVRVESECLTGHVLGSLLCDCSEQLKQGLRRINQSQKGALVYLRQEGRGIGLHAKLQAYYMQQNYQMDTVDANLAIGVPEEARDYLIGAQILYRLGWQRCQLLTNNPSKISGLEKYGIKIDKQVSHIIPAGKHNLKYLETKRDRMGHMIDERLNFNKK